MLKSSARGVAQNYSHMMSKVVAKKKKAKERKSKPKARKAKGKGGAAGLQQTVKKLAPVSVGTVFEQKGPKVRGGNFTVTHCEFLQNIMTDASGNVATTQYNLNAALSDSFPWLGALGANFEFYRVDALHFKFQPLAPSSAAGQLAMVIDYDLRDLTSSFAGIGDYINYQGSVISNIWLDSQANFRPNRRMLDKYLCRTTTPPSSTDVHLYDVGNFYFMVDNCSLASAVIGRLLVSYTITFSVPRIAAVASTLSSSLAVGSWAGGGNYAAAYPLNQFHTNGDNNKLLNVGYFPTKLSGGNHQEIAPLVGDNKSFALGPGIWNVIYQLGDLVSGSTPWGVYGTVVDAVSTGLDFDVTKASMLDCSNFYQHPINIASAIDTGVTQSWLMAVSDFVTCSLDYVADAKLGTVWNAASLVIEPAAPLLSSVMPFFTASRAARASRRLSMKRDSERKIDADDGVVVSPKPPRFVKK